MTVENQDIEPNSDVDDSVQEIQSTEIENDDVDFTEITFDGEPLNDDDSDDDELETETNDDLNSETGIETEAEKETPLVNTLRKNSRQKDKQIKRLKLELEQTKKQFTQKPIELTKEPVLPKLSDYDYDDDDYQQAVNKYADDLVKYKAVQEKRTQEISRLQQTYIQQKAKLNIPNFDNYENVITSNLDIARQNLILKTDNPALIVVALAKNPELLSELSDLSHEDFAYKIAKIEQKIQVNTVKKPKPKPESKTMISGGTASINRESELKKLEAEANKTGDYSKVYSFKKKNKC